MGQFTLVGADVHDKSILVKVAVDRGPAVTRSWSNDRDGRLAMIADLKRFRNRRQIGAYLGLVPSAAESGEQDDRKGHITREGSARLRKVLCQATWARVKHDPEERKFYTRLAEKNPKHKKKAVVAVMRRLGIRLWHAGLRGMEVAG